MDAGGSPAGEDPTRCPVMSFAQSWGLPSAIVLDASAHEQGNSGCSQFVGSGRGALAV